MDMDCNKARNYMDGFLDRELDPVTSAGIETHLKACTNCAKTYARKPHCWLRPKSGSLTTLRLRTL